MDAVRFRIKLDELEMLDWEQWGTDDQDYIVRCAKANKVEIVRKNSILIFKGSYQGMFWLLQDVAKRYDVELI